MPIDNSLTIQSLHRNSDCSSIVLGDYLRRKRWSVKEALMLFTGLNPRKHDIAWESEGVLVYLRHVEKLGYERCPSADALMSRADLQQKIDRIRADAEKRLAEAYRAPVQMPVEKLTLDAMMPSDVALDKAEIRKWLTFYDEAEKLLGSFLQAWLESREEALDHQLPPSTFFRWAAENSLIDKIPWWEDAVEKGFKNQFMGTTSPSSPSSSEDSLKERVEKFFLPVVQGRLESERIKLEDLSHALQEEIKKLVASLAEEKQGAVSNILLIGNTTDNQLETFLAVTKAALEIVGLSKLVDQSTGADDLIARFRKADFPKPTTYGADSCRHRHWVIEQLEAFPFTVGVNISEFAKIKNAARIVATASPNSQTPLPREIEELFKIKVDFGMLSEVQVENGGEVSAAPALAVSSGKPALERKRGRKQSYFRETIEYLYKKLNQEGETEPLKAGNVGKFIELMRSIRNADQDDFVCSRIKEVRKPGGKWRITTEEEIVKTSITIEISKKSRHYDQNDVSKVLTSLRRSKAPPL
jgi:hypothetical protein